MLHDIIKETVFELINHSANTVLVRSIKQKKSTKKKR